MTSWDKSALLLNILGGLGKLIKEIRRYTFRFAGSFHVLLQLYNCLKSMNNSEASVRPTLAGPDNNFNTHYYRQNKIRGF
jgi:hypothetical protein